MGSDRYDRLRSRRGKAGRREVYCSISTPSVDLEDKSEQDWPAVHTVSHANGVSALAVFSNKGKQKAGPVCGKVKPGCWLAARSKPGKGAFCSAQRVSQHFGMGWHGLVVRGGSAWRALTL